MLEEEQAKTTEARQIAASAVAQGQASRELYSDSIREFWEPKCRKLTLEKAELTVRNQQLDQQVKKLREQGVSAAAKAVEACDHPKRFWAVMNDSDGLPMAAWCKRCGSFRTGSTWTAPADPELAPAPAVEVNRAEEDLRIRLENLHGEHERVVAELKTHIAKLEAREASEPSSASALEVLFGDPDSPILNFEQLRKDLSRPSVYGPVVDALESAFEAWKKTLPDEDDDVVALMKTAG